MTGSNEQTPTRRGRSIRTAQSGLANPVMRIVLMLWALMAWACGAHAQSNAIEAVSASQQGTTTVLSVRMKAAPSSLPGSFSIANPPRLAFDFPDTVNAVGQGSVELSQGDARSANRVQAGDRTDALQGLLMRTLSLTVEAFDSSALFSLAPESERPALMLLGGLLRDDIRTH